MEKFTIRVIEICQLKVGMVTNKGIVETIWDDDNITITDGMHYSISKHKITFVKELPKQQSSFGGLGIGTF